MLLGVSCDGVCFEKEAHRVYETVRLMDFSENQGLFRWARYFDLFLDAFQIERARSSARRIVLEDEQEF